MNSWIGSSRIENYILLAIGIGLLIATVGFWFGVPCSGYPMWAGFALSLALLSICNIRNAVLLIAIVAACWILTAWTFPFVGVDYQVCHAPLQRALISGWNPIFQSTIEDLSAITGHEAWASHALFIPHVTQLVGALVAKSTGLFLAESFLSYVLIYALLAASARFAMMEWNVSWLVGTVFALSVTFPFAVFLIYIGAVDYPLYASLAFALFSILNYDKTHRGEDLFAVVAGLALAIGIKASGAGIGIVGLAYLLIRNFNRVDVRRAVVVAAVFVCIVNASPTLTTWIRYASPVYPVHTFNPAIPLENLTSDFTCNADGAQMGYFSRIVYAWFSKTLAIWGCSLCCGKPDFNPQFGVPGGVAGLKELFKLMMWCAVVALAVARKNRITVVCAILFALSNIAPLKYIGYGRYFLLIWMIPPLAAFNFIQNPPVWFCALKKSLSYAVCCVFGLLFVSILAKGTAHYIRQAAIEGVRQRALECAVAQGVRPLPKDVRRRFIVRERYRQFGVCDVVSNESELWTFQDDTLLPTIVSEANKDWNDVFPVCYKLSDYRRFCWKEALALWPRPLWEK